MDRDSNGFISTDSELLGFEVPVLYSGASGINVDNENYVISFTGTAYGSGGKTYQGISPIVVNNDSDKISANTAPFGVISPLYFAQDDDSGVVIGFSGDIDPVILSSKLDVSAFEAWQTGQYTNDIATITNNISAISSEIPDVSQFVTSSDLSTLSSEITATIPSTAGLASETYVQEQVSSKLEESVYASQSGNFLTAIPAGYATKDWVESQDYLTIVPPEYSTSSDLVTLSGDIVSQIPDVSNYATLTDLESTSADITALIPSTAGLATETYVNENTSGKADKSEIPDVSNFITNASAEETYQTIDGMTAYQPIGDYLTADALVPYSADWNNVSAKLDESAFSDVSGTFLTAHQDLSNYATESFVENVSADITALIPDTSDFITNTSAETTYQPIGNYLSSNALDGYATQQWVNGEVSSKLDTTAQVITAVTTASVSTGGWFPISVVRSLNGINISADYSYNAVCASADSKGDTFTGNYAKISALSDYQTTAGMSNYATTGDVSYLSAEIGNVEVLLASL